MLNSKATIYKSNQEKKVNRKFIKALENFISKGNNKRTKVKRSDIAISAVLNYDGNKVNVIKVRREFIPTNNASLIEKCYITPISNTGISLPKIKKGKYDFSSVLCYQFAFFNNQSTS